jgi:hypothetical protein
VFFDKKYYKQYENVLQEKAVEATKQKKKTGEVTKIMERWGSTGTSP